MCKADAVGSGVADLGIGGECALAALLVIDDRRRIGLAGRDARACAFKRRRTPWLMDQARRQPREFWYPAPDTRAIGIELLVSQRAGHRDTAIDTLLPGALFGLFCYATFELTSLSMLKHWTWQVVVVDVASGTFGGLVDRWPSYCQLACAVEMAAHRRVPQNKRDARASLLTVACLSRLTSAAARSGYRVLGISSPADRSSWPRRR